MSQVTRNIYFKAAGKMVQLSVNPKQLSISNPQKTASVALINKGDLARPAGKGLKSFNIPVTLFHEKSPFYNEKKPGELIRFFEKCKNEELKVRVVIKDILNEVFFINNLNYILTEGDKDIGLEIGLQEYREISKKSVKKKEPRKDDSEKPKYHIVKKGDTLWAIAKKYYKDGTRWTTIAKANGITNERTLQIGKKLVIP